MQKIKNNIIYLLAQIVAVVGRVLPRFIGLNFFGFIGRVAYLIPNREKNRTLKHLEQIYGSKWDRKKIREVACSVYENIGKNLFDAIWLSQSTEKRFNGTVHYDSLEDFQGAYDCGKGVIVITAHLGCFEMILHFFGRKGFQSFAIGQRIYDSRIDKMISNARRGKNIDYMHRSENPREIIRKLKQGKAFGVLIDQDTKLEGIYANFLGQQAYTPSGPVKMAMHFKIPVFVVTTARQKDNSHFVTVGKEILLQNTGNHEEDLLQNVELVNGIISNAIHKNPEQWVWMHRRWKRQPN